MKISLLDRSDSFRNFFKILSDRKVSLSFTLQSEFEERTDMLDFNPFPTIDPIWR